MYDKKTKLYHCPVYLFSNYELLGLSSVQMGKECGVGSNIIRYWLKKFNIRIRFPNWKENNLTIQTIHRRAYNVQPKPVDGKCCLCNKVKDKYGYIKLVHSNKNHTYRMPINPDEWWWIHKSCHEEYDEKEELTHRYTQVK